MGVGRVAVLETARPSTHSAPKTGAFLLPFFNHERKNRMLDLHEQIIEERPIGPEILQEKIYVLMRRQGDFLCARLARYHTPAWDRRIGLALQGRSLGQLQERIKALLDKIEHARTLRPSLKEAALYSATLTLRPCSMMSLFTIGIPNIRKDYIRCNHDEEGARLSFKSRSPKGRLATRPSKAIGFATAEQAGNMALERVIQLICLEY